MLGIIHLNIDAKCDNPLNLTRRGRLGWDEPNVAMLGERDGTWNVRVFTTNKAIKLADGAETNVDLFPVGLSRLRPEASGPEQVQQGWAFLPWRPAHGLQPSRTTPSSSVAV